MTIEKQNEINAQHNTLLRRLRRWATDIGYWLLSPWVAAWMRAEERKVRRTWKQRMWLESLLSLECEGEER